MIVDLNEMIIIIQKSLKLQKVVNLKNVVALMKKQKIIALVRVVSYRVILQILQDFPCYREKQQILQKKTLETP